jgi:DNA invertase Pin-like site-specific DNA recombinase
MMLNDIRNGVVDAVVVWDLDRLHRRPMELEQFIDLADEKHLALASIGGDADLSTDNGRLFARIKGAVARAEIERKSARQKRAARQRAEAGLSWGPRPFGYTESGGELVESEAAVLREAYAAILANASLYSIAARWNKAGITTSKGNTWTGRSLKAVLTRPRYGGFLFHGNEILGKAHWPAVVPEQMWRAANALLADPSRRIYWVNRKHLLTGLARCGKCGHTVGTGAKARVGTIVYTCKHCHGVSRLAAEVDNWVVWRVANALAQPDAWRALRSTNPAATAELREQESSLRSRLDVIAAEFADGVLTHSQLHTATVRIKKQLARIEPQLYGPNPHRYFGDVLDAQDPRVAFTDLPQDRQRELIEAMVTVTIMPIGHGGNKVFDPLMVEILPRNGFVCRP